MKNIKSLLIVFAMVFAVSSCDDATDIIQDGELGNSETFKSVNDLSLYLNGAVYSSLGHTNEIMISASFTDECGVGPSNGGQELQLHRFNLDKGTGYVENMWLSYYSSINRVNRLLAAAAGITPDASKMVLIEPGVTVSEDVWYNSILAEAKAVRAFAYFQLLTYYSTDLSDDNALGVMLFDYVPAIGEKLPRSTNGEVFTLIEADIAFAEANIYDKTAVNGYKYVSTRMLKALQARMYLYRKNYPLARANAMDAIAGLTLTPATPYIAGNFYDPVVTNNPYRRIWADLDKGEVIFALSRPAGGSWGNIAGSFFFNNSTATGGAFLDMGRNLYNELKEVNGDIRSLAFVDPTSLIDANYLTNPAYITTDVLVIDKYPGKPSQQLRNDLKIFRASEMYFILAECAIFDGDLPGAAGFVKNIRDARNILGAQPLPVYVNPTEAWADVLKERRKELCFEGHRYVDIKRIGVAAGKSIDRNVTDDLILSLPTTLSNTDYRFTLPIPQSEIAGNPTIQQNPGYN